MPDNGIGIENIEKIRWKLLIACEDSFCRANRCIIAYKRIWDDLLKKRASQILTGAGWPLIITIVYFASFSSKFTLIATSLPTDKPPASVSLFHFRP